MPFCLQSSKLFLGIWHGILQHRSACIQPLARGIFSIPSYPTKAGAPCTLEPITIFQLIGLRCSLGPRNSSIRLFACSSSTMPFGLILVLDSTFADKPCRGFVGFSGHWIFTHDCVKLTFLLLLCSPKRLLSKAEHSTNTFDRHF